MWKQNIMYYCAVRNIQTLRSKYLHTSWPSINKFVSFMSSKNVKGLNNLSKFIVEPFFDYTSTPDLHIYPCTLNKPPKRWLTTLLIYDINSWYRSNVCTVLGWQKVARQGNKFSLRSRMIHLHSCYNTNKIHVHIEAYKLIVLYSYKQNENNLHMNVFIVYVQIAITTNQHKMSEAILQQGPGHSLEYMYYMDFLRRSIQILIMFLCTIRYVSPTPHTQKEQYIVKHRETLTQTICFQNSKLLNYFIVQMLVVSGMFWCTDIRCFRLYLIKMDVA